MKRTFAWTISANNRGKISLNLQFGTVGCPIRINNAEDLRILATELNAAASTMEALHKLQSRESKGGMPLMERLKQELNDASISH